MMWLAQFFRLHKSDRQVVVALLLVALLIFAFLLLTGHETTAENTAVGDSLVEKNHEITPPQPPGHVL